MQASNVSHHRDSVQSEGAAYRIEKRLLTLLLRNMGAVPVRLMSGSGATVSSTGADPQFTLWIRDLLTLGQVLIDPEIGFGDAWSDGRIRMTGDLVAFLEAVYRSMEPIWKRKGWYVRAISKWLDSRQANTLEGSRRNIYSHYDLGNDFYRLWLDSRMVYTCAYFPQASATLEDAQTAKMDYICRKLRLQPGETVVEAGCGWGALALHMARQYGVRVKAFNISREQIRHARQRAREENAGDLVEFIEDDYRNASGKFDAFVSVGMLEHVGLDHYEELGNTIRRLIEDRGRGLLHFIGRSERGDFSRWIRKRIFPGAHAPTLREALQVLEPHGYFVRDVEDLQAHYATTLEHWLDRFDKSSGKVSAMYGAEFERAWRLYLAGSIAGFRTGTLQLFQIVFSGAKFEAVPRTRADLYRGQQADCAWTPATS
jgi:cyclopropane-fatty-acyl-phospholipid synthase